jgi:hypothetical protein
MVGWAGTLPLHARLQDPVAGLTRVTDNTTVNRVLEIFWVAVVPGRIRRYTIDPNGSGNREFQKLPALIAEGEILQG